MSIQVKFFASLRDTLGLADQQIEAQNINNVADVWQAVCADTAMPDNVLMARNLDYVGLDEAVLDGDEIAFFPPVTGG